MPVAGCLLTGGSSRRLGSPKATLELNGERLVDRAARVLASVCEPVVEVGPAYSSISSVREQPPGEGPLAALVAGSSWFRANGYDGPIVLLAVDLPFIDARLLEWLAEHPAAESVVPRVRGMAQSLCARYAPRAIDTATTLLERGERSMRALLGAVSVAYADEDEWSTVSDKRAFLDVDTAEDVARAGLQTPR